MKKHKSDEQIYIDILMNHGKLSGNIRKLKYQCSIRSMDNLIHKLWKNSRNFRKRAGDSLLPQEYYRLRMNRLVSYQETSLEQELNWGKNLLCLHADRLASFFKRKSRFENLVMQGYYPEAREELNAIQTECCFSLWGLEQEFLLQELEGGLEATKKFQNGLSFGCSNNWMNCFASFFSLKVERNLNNSQYNQRIQKAIKRVSPEIRLYFQMHLQVETTIRKTIRWQKVLYYASNSSLIDYFLDYCKVCSYLLCLNPQPNSLTRFICQMLAELNQMLPLPVLEKMIYQGEDITLSDREKTLHQIGIHYTEGKYNQVIQQCEALLSEDGSIFEAYEYLIKSEIITGRSSESSPGDTSLKSWLKQVLTDVYQKNPGSEQAFDELQILLRFLNGFSLAPELCHFYLGKAACRYSDFWKRCLGLHARHHNIRHCRCYPDKLASAYVKAFEKASGKSALTELYRIEQSEETSEYQDRIEPLRLQWYQARQMARDEQYTLALNQALQLKESDSLYVSEYLKEELFLFLVHIKAKLGFYEDALTDFIPMYLENPLMTLRIDKKQFYDDVREHLTNELKGSITLPILSYIANQHVIDDVYSDFANFMDRSGCSRPSDMVKEAFRWDRKQLISFLRYLCTTDMMDSMFWLFEREDDVLSERLRICQELKKLDIDNEKFYNEEISSLTQRQLLSQNLQYLDDQKIDFDMERLHNYYLEKFSQSFGRYREVGKIWGEIQKIDFNLRQKNYILTLRIDDGESGNYSADKRNQKYDMFTELLFELRDEVAFGRMGLDQSLGTRIRHGRLQNHIRRIFEERNMVFIRKSDDSSEYIPIRNQGFEQTFSTQDFNEKQLHHLKQIISDFTVQIDQLISDVRTKIIRIRTEELYPEGLIDMYYNNEDVSRLFLQGANSETAETLMELFEKDLMERIRTGLNSLGDYFQTTIRTICLNELEHLDNRLREFYEEENAEELYTLIHNPLIQCRTELQKELTLIAQWFRLPTVQEHPDYNMSTLLETCKATMCNINPGFSKVKLDIQNEAEGLWKGKTFSYFNEILIILFNNAIIHAGYKHCPEQLTIQLQIYQDNQFLSLRMTTNLAKDLIIADIEQRVKDVKIMMAAQKDRFYGKDFRSGYIKIQNMLRTYISPGDHWWLSFGLQKNQEHFDTPRFDTPHFNKPHFDTPHFDTQIYIPIKAIEGASWNDEKTAVNRG